MTFIFVSWQFFLPSHQYIYLYYTHTCIYTYTYAYLFWNVTTLWHESSKSHVTCERSFWHLNEHWNSHSYYVIGINDLYICLCKVYCIHIYKNERQVNCYRNFVNFPCDFLKCLDLYLNVLTHLHINLFL